MQRRRMTTRFKAGGIGVLALALLIAGCGGSGSGYAVVRIGDSAISKSDFDHWMRVFAAGQTSGDPDAPESGGTADAIPQPPDFKECIAELRASTGTRSTAQAEPTDAQLKATCQQKYESLRNQVLEFLISGNWIEDEAAQQGVEVSNAEIHKQLVEEQKQEFPAKADFDMYLKDSGMTLNDLLFSVRLGLLSVRLRENETKGREDVTAAYSLEQWRSRTIDKWRSRTVCREGYIVQDCGNSP
jgi:SurA-like N-terminal domain